MKFTETELNTILKNWGADGLPQIIIGKEIEIDQRSGKNYRLGKAVDISSKNNKIFITIILNKPWNGKKKYQLQVIGKSQARSWHLKCNDCNFRFLTKKQ